MKAGYGGDNSKWDIGTLLQHAVDNNNQHLGRILLDFGFVIVKLHFNLSSPCSVDPHAVSEGSQKGTPLEIAVSNRSLEMLNILAEFTEITNDVKMSKLSMLIAHSGDGKEATEDFQRTLQTLPLEMVRSFY